MLDNTKKKGIGTGTGLVIGIAVIYILLGLAMLLIPKFETSYIIYAAGVILLVYGIILIVKYFMSGSYKELGKYGFSGGALCLVIGICMLIRANSIAEFFPLFLGICILLTAIIKLQNAVALRILEDKAWFVFLIIALAFVAASLIIMLNIFQLNEKHTIYIYYILVVDGIVNLAETIYLAIALRRSKKSIEKSEAPLLETEEMSVPEDAVAFEPETADIPAPEVVESPISEPELTFGEPEITMPNHQEETNEESM